MKLKRLYELAKSKGKVSNNEEFAELLGINAVTLFRNFKKEDVKSSYLQKACEIAGVSENYYTSDIDDPYKFQEGSELYMKPEANVYHELEDCRKSLKEKSLRLESAEKEIRLQRELIEALKGKSASV